MKPIKKVEPVDFNCKNLTGNHSSCHSVLTSTNNQPCYSDLLITLYKKYYRKYYFNILKPFSIQINH